MKRTLIPLFLMAGGALIASGCYYYDAQGRPVAVPVHVTGQVVVAPPPLVIREDPDEVWLIPRTGVYFLPRVSADVFYYGGRWYYRTGAHWYWGVSFRGPWTWVHVDQLPPRVRHLPPDYRESYKHRPVPYQKWKERGYRWEDDADDDRDGGRKPWKERD